MYVYLFTSAKLKIKQSFLTRINMNPPLSALGTDCHVILPSGGNQIKSTIGKKKILEKKFEKTYRTLIMHKNHRSLPYIYLATQMQGLQDIADKNYILERAPWHSDTSLSSNLISSSMIKDV